MFVLVPAFCCARYALHSSPELLANWRRVLKPTLAPQLLVLLNVQDKSWTPLFFRYLVLVGLLIFKTQQ